MCFPSADAGVESALLQSVIVRATMFLSTVFAMFIIDGPAMDASAKGVANQKWKKIVPTQVLRRFPFRHQQEQEP